MKRQRMNFYLVSIVFLIVATFNVHAEEPCYVIVGKSGIHNVDVIRSIGISLISEHVQKVMPPPASGFSKKDCHYELNLVETLGGLHISISGKDFNGFGIAKRKGPEGVREAILNAVAKTKKPEPVEETDTTSEEPEPAGDDDLTPVVAIEKPEPVKKTTDSIEISLEPEPVSISDITKQYLLTRLLLTIDDIDLSSTVTYQSLSLHPNNRIVAYCTGSNGIVYDFIKAEVMLKIKSGCTATAFHPSGEYLAFGVDKSPVFVSLEKKSRMNLHSKLLKKEKLGRYGSLNLMGFSPDGRFLLYGDGTHSKLLNLKKGTIRQYKGKLKSIFFTPDSNFVKRSKNSFELVNPVNGIVINRIPLDIDWIEMVTYSSDLSYAAIKSSFRNDYSSVYSVREGEFIKNDEIFNLYYESHIMHPFSPHLLIVLTHKSLKFYDVRDFTQLAATKVECTGRPRFILSNDGKMLIVAHNYITGPHIYVFTNNDYQI